MLPKRNRLTRTEGFSRTLRKGVRAGDSSMVVSVLLPEDGSDQGADPVRFGIVVGKNQVPLSTDRNRVKRRLRNLLHARAGEFPAGTRVVVRALKTSAGMSSEALGSRVDALVALALKKARRTTLPKRNEGKAEAR